MNFTYIKTIKPCCFIHAESAGKNSGDERKRKQVGEGSPGVLGDKRSKAGSSSLLTGGTLTRGTLTGGTLTGGTLTGGTLTGGLALTSSLSKGLLTSCSLLTTTTLSSHSAGLSLKLESPLSRLRVGESRSAAESHASRGAKHDTKTASKSSRSGEAAQAKKTHRTDGAGADLARSKLGKSKKKKMKLDGKSGVTATSCDLERHDISPPDYSFRMDEATEEPMELISFIPPEKDMELTVTLSSSLQDIAGLKVMFEGRGGGGRNQTYQTFIHKHI